MLRGETAQAYKARLDRLVKNMVNAKPQKLSRSDAEKRLKYLQGMKRGGRYLGYIKEAERDETELDTVHNWMVEKDRVNSKHILRKHGMLTKKRKGPLKKGSGASIATTEVLSFNTEQFLKNNPNFYKN